MSEWIDLIDDCYLQMRQANDGHRVELKSEEGKIVGISGSIPYCQECYDSLRKLFAKSSVWIIGLDPSDIIDALFGSQEDLYYFLWSNGRGIPESCECNELQDISQNIIRFVTSTGSEITSIFLWAYGDWDLLGFSEVINSIDIPDYISVFVTFVYAEEVNEKSMHALIV